MPAASILCSFGKKAITSFQEIRGPQEKQPCKRPVRFVVIAPIWFAVRLRRGLRPVRLRAIPAAVYSDALIDSTNFAISSASGIGSEKSLHDSAALATDSARQFLQLAPNSSSYLPSNWLSV